MSECSGPSADEYGEQALPQINAAIRAGLRLLYQASVYARDSGADLWDFAVEIDNLYKAGLSIGDLGRLITNGMAESGRETTVYGDCHRSFRPSGLTDFDPGTCFVITPKGAEFAAKFVARD